MRHIARQLASMCSAGAFFISAAAAAPHCDLSLVLAVDASASVDAREYGIQTQGLADALRAPEVTAAILTSGGVYLSVFEWSGSRQQVLLLDWTELNSLAAIDAAAAKIAATRRQYTEFPTSMGPALAYASGVMDRAPARCLRKVVDISGDGVHNYGYGPRLAYENFDFSDITVNGLVITDAWPDPLRYYYEEVLHGKDAFVVEAHGFRELAKAMRRKLVREIKGEVFTSLSR